VSDRLFYKRVTTIHMSFEQLIMIQPLISYIQ